MVRPARVRFAQGIHDQIEQDPDLKKKQELLKSVPGVGKVLSATLISHMPELGSCNRKEIAALGGLAPDIVTTAAVSGADRMIQGGRPFVRKAALHGHGGLHPFQSHYQSDVCTLGGCRQTGEGCLGGLHA